MRPQSIALLVASTITALFVAAVGVVAIAEFWPASAPQPARQNPQDPVAFQFFGAAPVADLDFPIEADPIAAPVDVHQARGAVVAANDYVLSGPHAHGNLAVFLIHGPDKLNSQKIMTLQDGLAQGLAVVHETRGAQLRIDNRSNAVLFIQGGDIVKGGTQDRTLPFDMLIAANTNNVPLQALCVEEGRSAPRGDEISTSFQTATQQLPGHKLRLAAANHQQAQVWANVRSLQQNLARNAGGSVQAQQSATSLQLTLEHGRVQGTIQKYVADLGGVVDGKKDAIGYAAVVNGRIQSADVYGSSSLFQSLWPKLLNASAVDALAERQPGVVTTPTAKDVQAFLTAAEAGQRTGVQGAHRGVSIRHESAQHLLIETCDPAQANAVLHRTIIAK